MIMKRTLLIIFWQFCLLSVAQPQSITIPAGTEISIRTATVINSKKADTSTEYQVSMDDPVTVNGVVVVPVNANAWLRATDINNPRLVGRASMSTTLVAVTGTNGERIGVTTGKVDSQAGSHAKRTLAGAGVGAGAGAAIGAAAGGGLGAGVGAATGGTLGAAIGKMTGNNEGVTIPSETRYTYTLAQPVTINYQGPSAPTESRIDYSQPNGGVSGAAGASPPESPLLPLESPVSPQATSDNLPPSQTSLAPPDATGIKVGQTTEQVVAQWGKPDKVSKSGTAEVYRYKEIKVLFVGGKVTEVY
jgi:hypothetical protein